MIADPWIAHLTRERRPANTVAAARRVLRSLPSADTATREDVESWWASRAHLSPATRSNDLAILRTFYAWCRRWEHRDDDPTLRIDAPKVPRGLPRPMSRADLTRLLPTLPDLETRRIRVLGKGGKTRLVGMSPLLLDELLPDAGGNVVTAGGAPYSAAALQRRVNRAIRAAGVDCTYHQLRHRFGTVALAATGNLLAVSRAMGHASPATTAIYAATSDADLDVIADAVEA